MHAAAIAWLSGSEKYCIAPESAHQLCIQQGTDASPSPKLPIRMDWKPSTRTHSVPQHQTDASSWEPTARCA